MGLRATLRSLTLASVLSHSDNKRICFVYSNFYRFRIPVKLCCETTYIYKLGRTSISTLTACFLSLLSKVASIVTFVSITFLLSETFMTISSLSASHVTFKTSPSSSSQHGWLFDNFL